MHLDKNINSYKSINALGYVKIRYRDANKKQAKQQDFSTKMINVTTYNVLNPISYRPRISRIQADAKNHIRRILLL